MAARSGELRTRWWRPKYGLRAMFVVLTVCAIAFAYVRFQVSDARKQWEVEQKVISALPMGTSIWKESQLPTLTAFLVPEEEQEYFDRVVEVHFGNVATDQEVAALPELLQLEKVSLGLSRVSDDGLRHIGSIRTLEHLDIQYCDVTTDGWKSLIHLSQLRHLRLSSSIDVTNEALGTLAKLRGLEELIVESPSITDEGLVHIAQLKELRNLSLLDTRITGSGLDCLATCEKLVQLELCRSEIDDYGLRQLRKLPSLQVLNLSGNDEISASGVCHVTELPELRKVYLPARLDYNGCEGLRRRVESGQLEIVTD